MKKMTAPLLAAILFLAGCATVSVPWYEQVKSYPLIRLGDPKPADGKYVVHLPAGQPVTTKIHMKGSIFREASVQEAYATPKTDVYFYKDWISFDMSHWTRARETLDIGWDITLPGYKNPVPGSITIKIDRKE